MAMTGLQSRFRANAFQVETAASALGGWPCCSLDDLGAHIVSAGDLRDRMSSPPQGGVIAAQISDEEQVNVRFGPDAGLRDGDGARVLSHLKGINKLRYNPQWFILIDQPCYVVLRGGAVILRDGRILSSTVWEVSHNSKQTLGRLFGIDGLTQNALATLISAAPYWNDSIVPAPIYSRWSNVYSHALSESLVHEASIRRFGLGGLACYLTSSEPTQCERVVGEVATHFGDLQRCFAAPILAVPRVLLSSYLYRFANYDVGWRLFTREMVAEASKLTESTNVGGGKKVYVSRLGSTVRPMRNEAELIHNLEKRNFTIFDARGMSFFEQVRAFTKAELIVGPHGSGLTNAGFAPPGATVLELRPLNRGNQEVPMVDSFQIRVCAGSDLVFSVHISDSSPENSEWYANIPEILSHVDALIQM